MTRHIIFTVIGLALFGIIDLPIAVATFNIVGIECSKNQNRLSINPFTVEDVHNPASFDSDWLEVVKGQALVKGDFTYYSGQRIEHRCKLKDKTIDTLIRYRQPSEYGPDGGDPGGVLDVTVNGIKMIHEAFFHWYAHTSINKVSYSNGKLELCVSSRGAAKCLDIENSRLPVTDIFLYRILPRE